MFFDALPIFAVLTLILVLLRTNYLLAKANRQVQELQSKD